MKNRIIVKAFLWILLEVEAMFLGSKVCPEENIGVIAAQYIGEPENLMTLNNSITLVCLQIMSCLMRLWNE